MNEVSYLIYILAFIIGSIVGLLLSYKKHGEPFIDSKIELLPLILAIIGWVLVLNSTIFLLQIIATISIGLFLIGLVIGMRPGYGRYETLIGIIVSVIIWLILNLGV